MQGEFSRPNPENNNPNLHIVTISCSRSEIFNNGGDVLGLIKNKLPQEFSGYLQVDQSKESQNYSFRGITRRNEDSKKTLDIIKENGHELNVENDTTSINVTNHPNMAANYAMPKHSNETGFLLVYDNNDKFFDDFKYYHWASNVPADDSLLKDKIRLVIVIEYTDLLSQPRT